jgi:hypothetical protein
MDHSIADWAMEIIELKLWRKRYRRHTTVHCPWTITRAHGFNKRILNLRTRARAQSVPVAHKRNSCIQLLFEMKSVTRQLNVKRH